MSRDDKSQVTDRVGNLSRREWIRALGLTGVASMAGCAADDSSENPTDTETSGGGGDTTDDGTGGGERRRADYLRGGVLFTDLNWNPFSDNYNSSISPFFDTYGAVTRETDTQVVGFGYSDFGYDSDDRIASVALRDDITFHDGDQYTAEDFWTYHEMLRLQAPESSNYASIEQTGDYSLEFTTKKAWNPDIAVRSLISGTSFQWGAQIWTEWLEQYQDASNQDARDTITEDLSTNMAITHQDLKDEGLGTGAYMIDQVTETYIDLLAYEDHFTHAGRDDRFNPNIDYIRLHYGNEKGRIDQLIVNEKLSFAGHGSSGWDAYRDQLPDYWKQIHYGASSSGAYKMLINWRNREYLQDVNFRRAMAAAIDHENAATNTREFQSKIDSGMGPAFNENYWGEEVPSNLIDYGVKARPDLMEEYLSKSDYELDGSSVVGPDGESHGPMRFVIGGGPWGENAQVAAAQLDQAGFPIEQRPVDRSTKLDIIQQPDTMGDWDLSTETHYAGITYHPSEFFKPGTFWGWRIGPGGFGPTETFAESVEGWLDEGRTHSPYNGKAMVFEIPSEVGSETLEGDTQTVNIYENFNEATGPISVERTKELIQKLSWAWNYMVPDIDITWAVEDMFGNGQKFEFDEEGVDAYQPQLLFQNGDIRFRE